MKKTISIILILLFSLMTTAYEQTENVDTTVNITVIYYGCDNADIKIFTEDEDKIYHLYNETHEIIVTFPHTFSYDYKAENISEACSQISVVCSDFLDYLNDSLPYTQKYADEKERAGQAEEASRIQNERRKELENKLTEVENKVQSYERYYTEYKVCEVEAEQCYYDLKNQTSMREEAESQNMSWGFGGGAIVALIAYGLYWYQKKAREPGKDIKEEPPAEEPS